MDEILPQDEPVLRYLDGEMTEEEKRAFEAEMAADPSLSERVESLRAATAAIRQYGTLQAVRSVHQKFLQNRKAGAQAAPVVPVKRNWRPYFLAAASVILLVVLAGNFFLRQTGPEQLYRETFVDYTLSGSRSGSSITTPIQQAYSQKKYKDVIALSKGKDLQSLDSLLTGLSFLHSENFSSSTYWLQWLQQGGGDYRQDAEFYLALSYLRSKQYNLALGLMESIATNPSHLYHRQISSETLNRLRNLKN